MVQLAISVETSFSHPSGWREKGQSLQENDVTRQLIKRWCKNVKATGPSKSVKIIPQEESVDYVLHNSEEKIPPLSQ